MPRLARVVIPDHLYLFFYFAMIQRSGRASDPPPHPAVRARLEAIHQAEAKLDIDGLVKMGVEGVVIREFRYGEG